MSLTMSFSFSLLITLLICYYAQSFMFSISTISSPSALSTRRLPMKVKEEKNNFRGAVDFSLFFNAPTVSPSSVGYSSSTISGRKLSFTRDIRRKYDESIEPGATNPGNGDIGGRKTAVIREFKIPEKFFSEYTTIREKKNNKEKLIENEFKKHGMPWKTSIEPTYNRPHLFYMPFWEMQKEFMKKHLTNLRPLPVTTRDGSRDLSYVEKKDENEKVRMSTVAFTCDEFRKIRMTFYDAGNQTQIFTSLWYPQPHLGNLPLFGTDLLQFNQNRHLCIVDVQPLKHGDNNQRLNIEDHCDGNNLASSFDYEKEILKPIRDQYPSLQEKMTEKFYEKNQFFSKQMLLGRFEQVENKDEKGSKESNYEHAYGLVYNELMPAYEEYLKSYLQMVQSAVKVKSNNHLTSLVIDGQRQNDEYHEARDPGHALFKGQFGKQFADDFVHDILFSYSNRESE